MPKGSLAKVDIKDVADSKIKIKREFFLTKRLFNEIVETIETLKKNLEEPTNFSAWVYDACKEKIKRGK